MKRGHVFRSYEMARLVANMTQRMTGDQCSVETHESNWYYVVRVDPTGTEYIA